MERVVILVRRRNSLRVLGFNGYIETTLCRKYRPQFPEFGIPRDMDETDFMDGNRDRQLLRFYVLRLGVG